MGLLNFFSKKKEPEASDSITNLSLSKLKKGYFLDYDLKSWEVKAASYYDWGDEDLSQEWQLVSHDETMYLEREFDDEEYWSVSSKISLTDIDSGLRNHIVKNDDPPDHISFNGVDYTLDESCGGHFYLENGVQGRKILSWNYVDSSGDLYLSIEQWGETEFEASTGKKVMDYQFTNILPGE